MREYRTTDGIYQWFFDKPLPGQSRDPEDQWSWGPTVEQIDWTGFDEALANLDEEAPND